jgi:hypothetical protein
LPRLRDISIVLKNLFPTEGRSPAWSRLTGTERVEELARMMSGTRVTEAARAHIKELLGTFRESQIVMVVIS